VKSHQPVEELPHLPVRAGGAELQKRLLREHARHQFVDQQIHDLENERAKRIRTSREEPMAKIRKLLQLRGIGNNSACCM
jgi:hypothetical protein